MYLLTIARPFLYLMSRAAGTVLRVFGSRETKHGAIHSPDELKLIVTASRQFGQIPPMQEEMIHKAIELENITVREVMVARPDIFSLPGNLAFDDALGRLVEEQHSQGTGLRSAAWSRTHHWRALCQGPDAMDAPASHNQSDPAGFRTGGNHED